MPHRVSWICTSLAGLLTAVVVLGTLPFAAAQPDKPKTPLWTHAFNLKCRNSKETGGFSDKTRVYGMEVFKDENTNLGIYLLETGSLGVTSGGFGDIKVAIKDSKALTWMHAMDVKVRKTGEDKFTENTQVLTIEVYRDDNTGNWVYISEKGYIAIVPGASKTGTAPTPGAARCGCTASISSVARAASRPGTTTPRTGAWKSSGTRTPAS